MPNPLSDRLLQLLHQHRLTQAELARRAALDPAIISKAIAAGRASAVTLQKIAGALGEDPASLVALGRPELAGIIAPEGSSPQMRNIPSGAATLPITAVLREGFVVSPDEREQARLVVRPEDAALADSVIRLESDPALEPYLHAGDWLLVRTVSAVRKEGCLVYVEVEGKRIIRRYGGKNRAGLITLRALNPFGHPDIVARGVTVLGVIVRSITDWPT